MGERRSFTYNDPDVEIIMRDGQLFIEASADYGDSESGWGSATKTIYLSREQVSEFILFLQNQP